MRISFLWICQGLFLLRVLGQIFVAFDAAPQLPAMAQWYSGTIPYPQLLSCQIFILMFMTLVNYQHSLGIGFLRAQRKHSRLILRVICGLYAGTMVLRLLRNAVLGPGVTHHLIPISFHFVLAAYLYLLSLSKKAAKP